MENQNILTSIKEQIKKTWHHITDDDLEEAGEDRSKLVEKIRKKHGLSKKEVETKLERFYDTSHYI